MADYRTEVLSLTDGEIEIKWVGKATPTAGEAVDIQEWFELIRNKIQRTFRENRKSVDAANFIDPGCGVPFEGTTTICQRPYGHTGAHEGDGYSWGATLEETLTDEEVATVLTGVMRSKEPRKFLGVDVDLPESEPKRIPFDIPVMYAQPPAPCRYCSGSVINHAPGCSAARAEAAERASAIEGMREALRKKVEDIRANPTPPVQDEKPIEDEEPF